MAQQTISKKRKVRRGMRTLCPPRAMLPPLLPLPMDGERGVPAPDGWRRWTMEAT